MDEMNYRLSEKCVVPEEWKTVALPIWLLPDFADSNTGSIDLVHLLGFEFVMIPLAPLMLLRCLLANPECSFGLKLLLFAAGAVCPLLIALLLARFWSRRFRSIRMTGSRSATMPSTAISGLRGRTARSTARSISTRTAIRGGRTATTISSSFSTWRRGTVRRRHIAICRAARLPTG